MADGLKPTGKDGVGTEGKADGAGLSSCQAGDHIHGVGNGHQSLINTVGGVIKPNESLFTIVPKNAPLQVEAQIQTKDSGFVKPGMKIVVKLDMFEYTKYGTLPAKVMQVDVDTIAVNKNQENYPVWIQPQQAFMMVKGKREPLKPDMSLTADITVGKRKLFEFLLYPVLNALNRTAGLR